MVLVVSFVVVFCVCGDLGLLVSCLGLCYCGFLQLAELFGLVGFVVEMVGLWVVVCMLFLVRCLRLSLAVLDLSVVFCAELSVGIGLVDGLWCLLRVFMCFGGLWVWL